MKFFSCLFIFFWFSTFLVAQKKDLLYEKLEHEIQLNIYTSVIKSVDSLIYLNVFSKRDLAKFSALKVESLIQENQLPDALKLSNEILKDLNNVYERTEVYLRILRALIFEFFDDKNRGLLEFTKIERIYKTRKKDRLYGRYLFRKSSFYKVITSIEQGRNKAEKFAKEAILFGDTNNFHEVSGTARFLQNSFIDDNDTAKKKLILKEALRDFKILSNRRNMSMIYINLARLNIQENNYKVATKYLDSTIYFASKSNETSFLSLSYEYKSKLFEKESKLDSALYYFRQYHSINLDLNFKKQEKEITKINSLHEINAKKLATEISKVKLLESERNNKFLLFSIAFFMFLVLFIFLLYGRLKRKNRKINYQNRLLKKNIDEKEILLKELNHRVKNNLSLIISLIKFQSQKISDSFYIEKFNHLENRITSIAIAHEQFVYSDAEINGEFYNLEEYLNKISASLINVSTRAIIFDQNINVFNLTIDTALPIGILMNELISNSIEHAKTEEILEISVNIEFIDDWITILYQDSGQEFKINEASKSLGLFIIDSMVDQLEGEFIRENSNYEIKLKKKL